MSYGVNESRKLFCKTHEQFHPSDENCAWCEPCKPTALSSYEQEVARLTEFIDTKYPIPDSGQQTPVKKAWSAPASLKKAQDAMDDARNIAAKDKLKKYRSKAWK